MQQVLETAVRQAANEKDSDELIAFVQQLVNGVAERVAADGVEGREVGRQAKAIVLAALKDTFGDELGDDFDWSGLEGETLRPTPQVGDEIVAADGVTYRVDGHYIVDDQRTTLHCRRPRGDKYYAITHFANPRYREFSYPVSW